MLIEEKTIKTNVKCQNWQDVVYEVGTLLFQNGFIKKEYINDMIEAVKEFGPYMILVPKIAFFHSRPNENVIKTGLSFITLENEVLFDDFDNQKIKYAFGFCAKDSDSHLEMLKEIAMCLQNKKFLNLLESKCQKEELINFFKKFKEV